MLSAEQLAARFRAPERRRDGWWVFCPAHADGQKAGRRSLRVSDGRRGPLLKCWAGCQNDGILAAVGLTWPEVLAERAGSGPGRPRRETDRVVATYDYRDEAGDLLFQAVRLEPDPPVPGRKRFFQRRPDPARPGEWVNNLDGTR